MLSEKNTLRALHGTSPSSVYIHVPFCVSKCAYCDFYSIPCTEKANAAEKNTIPSFSQECFSNGVYALQKRYVDALCRQMRLTEKKQGRKKVSTVFIGGGTPSVLKTEYLKKILDTVFSCFDLLGNAEITVEANPETVDLEKLTAYKKMGINRLSLGMQSAVDSELKTISRIHTALSVREAFKNARTAGFDNVSLDVMYALPGQTEESFKLTLDTVISLSPEHVSVYGLQLEEGTPLFNNQDSLTFPGEEGENRLNALALDVLTKNGYGRYEISNYAKKGYECRHNLNYWTLGEYYGFGTAAHSFTDGKRMSVKKDIAAYCASTDFSDVTEVEEIPTDTDLTEEYVMLSLRLKKGLSLNALKGITDSADLYFKRAEPFVKNGLMEIAETEGDTRISFTPSGFNVSNAVISEILFG